MSTPEELYDFCLERFTLLKSKNIVARICRTSCVLTNVYEVVSGSNRIPLTIADGSVSYGHLQKIYQIAKTHGCKFAMALVPDPHRMDELLSPDDVKGAYRNIFRDMLPLVYFTAPGTIKRQDYISTINTHFNNSGNKKFADLLDSVITEQLQ